MGQICVPSLWHATVGLCSMDVAPYPSVQEAGTLSPKLPRFTPTQNPRLPRFSQTLKLDSSA